MSLPTCPFPACDYLPANVWDLGDHLQRSADAEEHQGVWEPLEEAVPPRPRGGSGDRGFVPMFVLGPGDPFKQRVHADWGTRVRRYTENYGTHVIAEMPCCPRDPLAEQPSKRAGRGVRIEFQARDEPEWAPCPEHHLLWRVALNYDVDGGYEAVFDMHGRTAAVAMSRKYTKSSLVM